MPLSPEGRQLPRRRCSAIRSGGGYSPGPGGAVDVCASIDHAPPTAAPVHAWAALMPWELCRSIRDARRGAHRDIRHSGSRPKPGWPLRIAVITLFYAANHWNAFFNSFIYLNVDCMNPSQIVLREILSIGR